MNSIEETLRLTTRSKVLFKNNIKSICRKVLSMATGGDCIICMKPIFEKDKTITSCNHTFHFSCLIKNFKYNKNTGEQCPLCRKRFMNQDLVHNSFFQRLTTPMPTAAPRGDLTPRGITTRGAPSFSIAAPTIIPPPIISSINGVVINRNTIIQPRRRIIAPQRRQPVIREQNETEEERRQRIKTYISDLSFDELKRKLKEKGGSSRGYLRDSLERRLYRVMRNQ